MDDKKKKKKTDRYNDSGKYEDFRKSDKSGRSATLVGRAPNGQYPQGSAPRVGGVAKKGIVASGTASKKQVSSGTKAMNKRSSASPAAKRTYKKL